MQLLDGEDAQAATPDEAKLGLDVPLERVGRHAKRSGGLVLRQGAPLRTAQTLAGEPGRVNELVVRVRPGADPRAVRARLSRALHRALPSTGVTFTMRDEEPAHRLIYKDAEGDRQTLDIFAFLLLGAAAFAAFNLISRTVEAQRRALRIG